MIDKIKRFLRGADEILGTEDDRIFKELVKIIPDLNEFESLYQNEHSEIQNAIPYLTLSSPVFQVEVHAGINSTPYPYKLVAVVQRKEKECSVLDVREYFEY